MRSVKYALLFAFTTILLSPLFAREIEETFKKNIPVNDATRLTVENRNGSIDVKSWDKDEVEVIAYKKVNADNREAAVRLMEDLKVVIHERGDEIEVITEYPNTRNKNDGGFWSWVMGKSGNVGYSVSYEIHVPEKFDLNLESTNGRIEVANCNGRMRLQTTNGKIIADRVSGSIRCNTTNGSINASLVEVLEDEEMNFLSTNGSIKVYLPGSINADVRAQTTNGSINCDLPISQRYSSSRKKLDGVINDGGMLIYLKTTNGSIHLRES